MSTRQRTGVSDEADYTNPVFQQAEEDAATYLRRKYGPASVADFRHKHLHYDFAVYLGSPRLRTLDVKADQRFHETNRVGFEWLQQWHDGRESPGWGASDLELVFYVSPSTRRFLLVDANKVRLHITSSWGHALDNGVLTYAKDSETKMSHGYLLPLPWLHDIGAVIEEGIL